MQITKIIAMLLIILLLVLGACANPTTTPTVAKSPTPAQQAPTSPTPTPRIPSIQGQVFFVDGTPGYKVNIMLRQEGTKGEFIDESYADRQGYYRFYDVSPGIYWIHALENNSWVINKPSAIVTVTSNITSVVENLSVKRDLYVLLINDTSIKTWDPYHPEPTVSGHNIKFTWTVVENAAYYDVEVQDMLIKYDSVKPYNLTIRTTNNTITWTTDLSALPYDRFRIDVTAYTKENIKIAANTEWFTVNKN